MENQAQTKNEAGKERVQAIGEERAQAMEQEVAHAMAGRNTFFFLGLSLAYGVCFAVAFYRNFLGITFPLITAVTLAVCGLFLKKNEIPWKTSNWFYLAAVLLLGISTACTVNEFVVFFNMVGIFLLVTVFMLRQFYDSGRWELGQYICNILFLYLSMIPELASPFLRVGYSLKQRRGFGGDRKKSGNAKYILLGILIGLPMVLVLVELLSSADQIFSKAIGSAFHYFLRQALFSSNLFLAAGLLLAGFFGSYCFLSALCLRNMPEWKQKSRRRNPMIAVTFLSMVTVVNLLFCGIQVLFLFTGGRLLPEGYTYAEYARQGFFQLLFVCICNLALVLFCLAVFQRHRVLRILLLVFSGCTYIMIASSAYRMLLYISTYHLSFLRVLVLWFLAMLAVLMAGVVLEIREESFQLFGYCMAVVTVFYLVFSFGRVDALVASYNIAQLGDGISYQDTVYLTGLSMDAVPALCQCRLPHENHERGAWLQEYRTEEGSGSGDAGNFYGDYYKSEDKAQKKVYYAGCRRCRLEWKCQQVLDATEDMGVRGFHFSKYHARKAALDFQKKIANHTYE